MEGRHYLLEKKHNGKKIYECIYCCCLCKICQSLNVHKKSYMKDIKNVTVLFNGRLPF